MTPLPPVASTAFPIYLSPVPTSLSVIEHATEVVAGWLFLFYELQKSHMHSAIPSPPTPRHDLSGFLSYLWWTLITKKGRRLDAEIKRTQNASFHIPAMATCVCIMRRMQSERMRSYNMRTADGSHKSRSLEVQWRTK